MSDIHLVSAVIPTLNRPHLVCRAVRSALAQTYANLEVVVVVDGPDPDTLAALRDVRDPRLRVVALPENVGGSEARNVGVREARGGWIAFLDDDDEWLAAKIESQINACLEAGPNCNFVACRYESRMDSGSRDLPDRFPATDEDWGEYIYVHNAPLLPSTYLVSKEVMLAVPFTTGLRSNQDSDWILRARAARVVVPTWVSKVQVVYHNEVSADRVTVASGLDYRFDWGVRSCPELLTTRAFSYYLLRVCLLPVARSAHPARNLARLTKLAFQHGRVDVQFLFRLALFFGAYRWMHAEFRRKLRIRCGSISAIFWSHSAHHPSH